MNSEALAKDKNLIKTCPADKCENWSNDICYAF